jgi:hypothetical protein
VAEYHDDKETRTLLILALILYTEKKQKLVDA